MKKPLAPPHAGHRQRLKKKAALLGLEGLEKHEALELMLFFFVPRKNTNTLSHLLLDKYGTIENIFKADLSSLLEIPGVTEKAARFLSSAGGLAERYLQSLHSALPLEKIHLPEEEDAMVFFLDGNKKIKSAWQLQKEGASPEEFAENIAKYAYRQSWKSAAVLYRGINPYPETWDMEFIIELDFLLKIREISILDVAKICKNAYYSFFKFRYNENSDYEIY